MNAVLGKVLVKCPKCNRHYWDVFPAKIINGEIVPWCFKCQVPMEKLVSK